MLNVMRKFVYVELEILSQNNGEEDTKIVLIGYVR